MAKKGMLPDEWMKTSLIEVWPESPLSMEAPFSGRDVATPNALAGEKELRPTFYVAVVRRRDKQWHYEVLKAVPTGESHIPHEVMERIIRMRERIMTEQRSQRGKDQALTRRLHVEDGDEERQDDIDDHETSS